MINSNRIARVALTAMLALLTAVSLSLPSSAQDARSGQWILDTTRGTGEYNLTLNYRSDGEGRGNNITSFRIDPDRLRGLDTREPIEGLAPGARSVPCVERAEGAEQPCPSAPDRREPGHGPTTRARCVVDDEPQRHALMMRTF